MTRPTVLLDVDGTLVDSNYLHTLAWSRAIIAAGEWAPMNAIHRLIGMGSDNLVPALLGHDAGELGEAASTQFDELIDEVRAFPGAAALIRQLADANIAVVLATSSPAKDLAHMVHLLDVGDALAACTTSEDVDRSKPHPSIFLTAMARVRGDPATTMVIGDSTWDIEAAIAAGLPCIAVESGGFSHAELSTAGAIAVYRDIDAARLDVSAGPLKRLIAPSLHHRDQRAVQVPHPHPRWQLAGC